MSCIFRRPCPSGRLPHRRTIGGTSNTKQEPYRRAVVAGRGGTIGARCQKPVAAAAGGGQCWPNQRGVCDTEDGSGGAVSGGPPGVRAPDAAVRGAAAAAKKSTTGNVGLAATLPLP